MPQPAAAPTTQNTPVPHADLIKRIADTKPEDRTSAQKQLARAIRLEKERADNMKKIAANREYLRLMEENEELTDEEADFLDDWYPQKEKGAVRTDDETDRTRKLKASARVDS